MNHDRVPGVKRVAVIVLVQRNAPQALAALTALRLTTSPDLAFETIAVLNGADDATIAAMQRGSEAATILVSIANLGFGGGCNYAARATEAEYLVFLNDDTLVDQGWLEALVDHADSDLSIAAVGSRVRFADGMLQEAGSILWSDGSSMPVGRGLTAADGEWCFRRDVTYASACALLVRHSDFDQVGGFDEAYYPAYYEDVDLCLSLAAIGKRVTFEPAAELVHFESQSTTSAFKSYLFRRNHRRLVQKWEAELSRFNKAEPWDKHAIGRAIDAAWGKRVSVLLIDDRLPDAGLGSGYGRMLELIRDLADTPYRVQFFSGNRAGDPRSVGAYGIGVVQRSLEEELSDEHCLYDIAIISRPHNYERFADLIRTLQPQCRICYDVESLFYRRLEKQALIESDPERRGHVTLEAEVGRKLEFGIARNVDRLVCISTDERAILEDIPGHAPVDFILPVARQIAVTETAFSEREPLAIFVAGWMAGEHSPNADALRWLADSVVPLLRRRVPYAKILVTGGSPPPSLLAYSSASLQFAGYVSDLGALYARARLSLSPVRFGAGVKIKTVESIQYGVPVVSTTVGAEGLSITNRGAIAISDDPNVFADEIARGLTDADFWSDRSAATRSQSRDWLYAQRQTWRDVCDALINESDSLGRHTSA
jgi:GT2 family glycosyltransferase/glycosyltransferase involved in cell wall biosynthesis